MKEDGTPVDQVQTALDERAVLVRQAGWGTLRLSGPERASWLNGIVTCDVQAVTTERGAWGLLLTKQGKIQAELQIVAGNDTLFVGVSGGEANEIAESLDRFLVMEDAELELVQECRWWELHGALAPELASSARALSLGSGQMSWTVLPAAALVAPVSAGEQLEALLQERGALLVDEAAWEPHRIRLGKPRFGVDFGTTDNPHAASLERRAVSWTKGCYLGQEVVCMQDMRGKVKRRLARLELDAPAPALAEGTEVLRSSEPGDAVGTLRSHAERFAFAFLSVPADEPGTRLEVGGVGATVLPGEGAGSQG